MNVRTGCDIVHIKKFKRSVECGALLEKVFTQHELDHANSAESRAGIFAAKEATIKALNLSTTDWKQIEITKNVNGRPEMNITAMHDELFSHDLSISHDGDYAIATTIFLFN